MYVVQDPKDKKKELPEGPCKGESAFESGFAETAAVIGVFMLPTLLESIGESKLDEVHPDGSS
jgi:hypothetical protein